MQSDLFHLFECLGVEGKRSRYISEICMAIYGEDAHIAKLVWTHFYETYSSKTNTKAIRAFGLEAMEFMSNILSQENHIAKLVRTYLYETNSSETYP